MGDQDMARKAYLFTSGDGRPSANAFWMPLHLRIIGRVEEILRDLGFEPDWLHNPESPIDSAYRAVDVGRSLMEAMGNGGYGSILINLTTGWNFPEHFGVVATMAQYDIRSGRLRLFFLCNMEEKAPGYVAARANALICERMELPYQSVVFQASRNCFSFALKSELKARLDGTFNDEVPKADVEITDEHWRIAREAIEAIRMSGGVVPLINASSMTMAQGWPDYYMFKRLGLTPVFVGSNEFQRDMAEVPEKEVEAAYDWLVGTGISIEYEHRGLMPPEILRALRMYLVKLGYFRMGAMAMGTQGQMDTTMADVATDLSETLMMTSLSYGKSEPVVDVTEADCEGLWTSVLMQYLIHIKYGTWDPIGFHDVRHYYREHDLLVLLNSGALSLDFMTSRPGDYSGIRLVSQNRDVYFLNGGACVYGNMTSADNACMFRAHGKGQGYSMLATRMDVRPLSWNERRELFGKLDRWPMGIVRVPGKKTWPVASHWIPNHSHHCNADIMHEMAAACKLLGVPFHCFAA